MLAELVMLAVLVYTWLVGAPLGYGMIASGVMYLMLSGVNLSEAAGAMAGGITANIVVLAVPLFILTSYVMNSSGMTDRIFRFAQLALGSSRGSLAQVNVVGTLIFSGMTGSAVADTAGIGVMSVRAMEGASYPKGFACGTTITSSIMGPLVPPSIPIVIYGFLSNTSIGALFVAGLVPGVGLAIAHMVQIGWMARHRDFPRDRWRGLLVVFAAFIAGMPAIVAPAILIIGIYTGIFTPSESAAMAVIYTLLVAALVYRSLSWRMFLQCLAGGARQMGAVTTLIAGAFLIDYGVTASQLSVQITSSVLSLSHDGFVLVVLSTVIVLVLGLMFDVIVLEFVVLPIFVPVMVAAHVNMIYFGIVFTFATMIALGMPTLGTLNFVLAKLTATPLRDIIRSMWPFLGLLWGGLAVLILFPQLSLWLPQLLHMSAS
jgi:tripartite ATP-independent transporter DctM subunit